MDEQGNILNPTEHAGILKELAAKHDAELAEAKAPVPIPDADLEAVRALNRHDRRRYYALKKRGHKVHVEGGVVHHDCDH